MLVFDFYDEGADTKYQFVIEDIQVPRLMMSFWPPNCPETNPGQAVIYWDDRGPQKLDHWWFNKIITPKAQEYLRRIIRNLAFA